jgi:hypothetical protein
LKIKEKFPFNHSNLYSLSDQFLQHDECFGLFKLGDDGELDLPVAVEGDAGIPFHIVHSDPDHQSPSVSN